MARQRDPRTALVTGGTDGIGREIARGLAGEGVRVAIVGRDAEKGVRTAAELGRMPGGAQVTFLPADLSLVREADRLADEVRGRWAALNYLVLCAGTVRGRRVVTAEGIESNFAVNYLTRFALVRSLLPALAAAGAPGHAARILLVSGAARGGRIQFEDVNLTRNYSVLRMVLQSCQANDTFTVELARRLAADGPAHVSVACLKIGVVKTQIRKEFPTWMKWLVPLLFDPLLGQTAAEAAAPALRLLTGGAFEDANGALFQKIRKFKRVPPDKRASGVAEGRRLWELSDLLTRDAAARC